MSAPERETKSDGAVKHQQPNKNVPFINNAKNMIMKRNETKTTLPTLPSYNNNNQSNHDSQKRKKKRKKKNDIQIPLPPKG